MTTIKEYKAMMEGATDAPWSYIDEWSGIYDAPDIRGAQVRIAEIVRTSDYKSNAQFIAASRNIAPELIRVIELAEDAIFQLLKEHDNQSEQWASEALSEIRKLKGK
ncbi:MAG: hypothetical protein KBC72_13890 [Acinetobacter sp.]|nr:hypothetical protein [Acinetobacter sp.]